MALHTGWFRAFLLVLVVTPPATAQISDQRVRESLREGVRFLKSKQEPNGSWPDYDYASFPTGVTSLCTLALLNAGSAPDDPALSRALTYLRKQTDLKRTYTVALQTLVFCAAEPKKDLFQIRRNVGWLQRAQRTAAAGDGSGSWGYEETGFDEDPSNAQFALLALYEAERAGVEVKDSTWRLALAHWRKQQRNDGSFGYAPETPSTGSMTCAGIGSLIIASGQIAALDATITAEGVQCCGSEEESDASVTRALKWLGDNFSVRRNPSTKKNDSNMRHYYYLYALERVGRLAGRRFIGDHDWYREGIETLLELQDELSGYWNDNDRLVSTAFAVLFLSKGRRPILMSKLQRQPEADWNHHRHDVAHLTRHVEERWGQDLTWQVVDLSAATAEDLWQSPVLFLTGRDGLELAQREKDALKQYIDMGGFLFAENCCDGQGFDRDFRALMAELFPDSPLRLLPPDHAIWYAEQRVDPKYLRPLEGIDACCRTGVVYCPENLSCLWELAVPQSRKNVGASQEVAAEIKACLAIGANVVTYATGRELRDKLDQSGLISVMKPTAARDRASLYIAKLQHSGGSDDAPSALPNLLAVIGQQTRLPVSTEKRMLSPTDPQLPDYPIAFAHGRRDFRWSQAERTAIRRFLENGGVLFADAICASDDFAASFRSEMRSLYPDQTMSRIPPQHPIFTEEFHGHNVTTVALNDPRSRERRDDPLKPRTTQIAPLLEGIEVDGRYVVIFSPYDMSCALENRPSLECRGYSRADAAKLATNIVLYAMQQ